MFAKSWLVAAAGLAAVVVCDGAPATTATNDRITHHISLSAADQAGFEARILQRARSGDKWLSHDELKDFVAAKPAHIAAVKSYLADHNVHAEDIHLSPLQDCISVTSTQTQARHMWTAPHKRLNDLTVTTDELAVPRHLQDAIAHIDAFHSTRSNAGSKRNVRSSPFLPLTAAESKIVGTSSSGCDDSLVTPACLRNLYGMSNYKAQPINGTLDIVTVLLGGAGADEADMQQYLRTYRSDVSNANSFKLSTNVSTGGAEPPGSLGHGSEGFLDVETIAGMAAPLNIGMIKYGSAETSDVSKLFAPALRYILDNYSGNKLPGVISVSFGTDETDVSESDAQELCSVVQKLVSQGSTVIFAAGDAGVAGSHGTQDGCKTKWTPPYPSGCPYVLSVGGTQGFNPVKVVNGSQAYYSGAGLSNLFQRPRWQNSPVGRYLSTLGSTGKGKFNSSGRAFPDIAADGLNLPVVVEGNDGKNSGTSAAAPVAASIIALANNQRQHNGKQRLGFLHPQLYGNSGLTTDVTQGSTGAQQCSDVIPATKGWDLASGWGYLNFQALVNA